MLEQVLRNLNNWFECEPGRVDTYTVEGGSLTLPFLLPGQYYRIEGSVFNDGLHCYQSEQLTDESFEGVITPLAIPRTVIDLAAEVESWQTKNGESVSSPYQSESFGGYSYSKASGKNGAYGWQDAFAEQLRAWRKI